MKHALRVGVSRTCVLLVERWFTQPGCALALFAHSPSVVMTDPPPAPSPAAGHSHFIRFVSPGPPGQPSLLVSASQEGRICVWDIEKAADRTAAAPLCSAVAHRGPVYKVFFAPDARSIVSSSADGTVAVHSFPEAALLARWHGTCNPPPETAGDQLVRGVGVRGLAVSCSGSWVVSGCDDGTVCVHNPNADASRIRRYSKATAADPASAHAGWVRAVAVSYCERFAVSGSDDRSVRVWSLQGDAAPRVLCGHADYVRAVATTSHGWAVSGSDDGTLRVWDMASGRALHVFVAPASARVTTFKDVRADSAVPRAFGRGGDTVGSGVHPPWIRSVAVSGDSTFVATAGYDRVARVWPLTVVVSADAAVTTSDCIELHGHPGWIRYIAVSRDSRYVITASYDMTLRVWSPRDGALLSILNGHDDIVMNCCVTSDCLYCASSSTDLTVKVWPLPPVPAAASTAEELLARSGGASMNPSPRATFGGTAMVLCVKFTCDGRWLLAACADRVVRVFDVSTMTVAATLIGHAGWVRCVDAAMSHPGAAAWIAISGSSDATVRCWRMIAAAHAASESADGVGATRAELTSAEVLAIPHPQPVISVCVIDCAVSFESPTPPAMTTVMLTGCGDLKIRRIKLSWDSSGLPPTFALQMVFAGHVGWVRGVQYLPHLDAVVSSSGDQVIRVWNNETGALVHTMDGHVHIVPGLAGASGVDAGTGKLHSDDALPLAFSASYDGSVRVWNCLSGGDALAVLRGHSGWVRSVAYHPALLPTAVSGECVAAEWVRRGAASAVAAAPQAAAPRAAEGCPGAPGVASCGYDGTVRLWRLTLGGAPASSDDAVTIHAAGPGRAALSVAISPNGQRLACGFDDGAVHILCRVTPSA